MSHPELKTTELTFTTTNQLLMALLVLCNSYGTQKKCAQELGVSPQYLHDILSEKRAIPEKVANQLGVTARVIYVPTEGMKAARKKAGLEQ